MIPRPRLTPPPASSASCKIRHVLELDPAGRARTNGFVAAPKRMAVWSHQKEWAPRAETQMSDGATGAEGPPAPVLDTSWAMPTRQIKDRFLKEAVPLTGQATAQARRSLERWRRSATRTSRTAIRLHPSGLGAASPTARRRPSVGRVHAAELRASSSRRALLRFRLRRCVETLPLGLFRIRGMSGDFIPIIEFRFASRGIAPVAGAALPSSAGHSVGGTSSAPVSRSRSSRCAVMRRSAWSCAECMTAFYRFAVDLAKWESAAQPGPSHQNPGLPRSGAS